MAEVVVHWEGMATVASRRPRFRRVKTERFQLTDRDIEMIRAVARHHFLRSTHLDRLFPAASVEGLRRRLQLLFHAGYLSRPVQQLERYRPGGGSSPMVYCLGNKGIDILAERYGIRRSKVDWTAKARTFSRGFLEHTLAVADFMVGLEAACRERGDVELVHFDELLATLVPETTRKRAHPYQWAVELVWQGKRETLHVEPDKIFALRYPSEPESRNRAFFFLEVDRGTMPVARTSLRQTSYLRKLLAYGFTYKQALHGSIFGMRNMRLLTVTSGPERLRNLIQAHQEHTRSLLSPEVFLFADKPGLAGGDLLMAPWRNGVGEEREPFLRRVEARSVATNL